jgi:putative transposase
MDGKGCWRDNVFVERLWKSVKYKEVYLKAYDSVTAAKTGLGNYLRFTPHVSTGRLTAKVRTRSILRTCR